MTSTFDCMDCGVDTHMIDEYPYLLQERLWQPVTRETRGRGMLCVGCLEIRLGRQLVSRDFVQGFNPLPESDRLKHRRSEQLS